MKCSKCPAYSFKLSRCKQGKINPPTIKGGIQAASFMGISYICAIDAENQKKQMKIFNKMNGSLK